MLGLCGGGEISCVVFNACTLLGPCLLGRRPMPAFPIPGAFHIPARCLPPRSSHPRLAPTPSLSCLPHALTSLAYGSPCLQAIILAAGMALGRPVYRVASPLVIEDTTEYNQVRAALAWTSHTFHTSLSSASANTGRQLGFVACTSHAHHTPIANTSHTSSFSRPSPLSSSFP